ncbi:MAG: dihydropteroate synthase [Dysgonamonadaceae bacterium]|jgi:dihydropteroate synthase|nr:dihydropteroate synthase [Dysgonamonadaceae bacterium]
MTSNIKGQLTGFVSPKVMGILNITPDSFFEKSRKQTEKEIAERVVQIVEEGADIIDIGGYSSRPSAAYVDETEEMKRLKYGLEILFREAPDAIVSVDTFRSEIACRCVEDFGVAIINDISAGALDDRMFETVARLQVPYIAMHMQGSPQTMMEYTDYANMMQEILLYFAEKVNRLHQTGVNDIWIDPGFGFSKTTAQNYMVLDKLEEFHIFGLPLLVGFSRKTMIREVLATSPAESLNGTTGLNMFALTKGAHILRVHDVKEAVQTVRLYKRIKNVNL